jgi:hypothetical protein
MADYKYLHYLTRLADARFDPAHPAGETTLHSGIYKCQGCGCEVMSNMGESLPSENHHQHAPDQDAIAWRLIVATA